MEHVIVLAMHGAPPLDFPRLELMEYFALHARAELEAGAAPEQQQLRYLELDARVRSWPRTRVNDPFWQASLESGDSLSQATGARVIVGFNEFCAPSVDDALDQAAALGPACIVVVTPMLTRGGEHAEHDIPAAIARARARHPSVPIDYAWPYDPIDVAQFLARHVDRRREPH